MKEKIGEIAGKIWEILGEKGEMKISQLPGTMKEKGDIVYQALGWLAREEKIFYSQKKNHTFVSLSDKERDIFKKAH